MTPDLAKPYPTPPLANEKKKRQDGPSISYNGDHISYKACNRKVINIYIPTIITPSGSAKPESVASLNACHLLGHADGIPT